LPRDPGRVINTCVNPAVRLRTGTVLASIAGLWPLPHFLH
jgi:hypothetical protein